ncbi:MAG: hypothetical protein IKU82_04060 [Clostridia bacterium]|nr:hypothetical protein [Clostridia bacterium]
MQKFIRIMAIVATVLIGGSFLLILLSLLFQRSIATNILGCSAETISCFPQIPVPQLLLCFLRLVCVALLIACCGNKKGGIWVEVIILICLVTVLPGINAIISPLYSKLVTYTQGIDAYVAYSTSNTITTFCLIPSGWGTTLAYITCGMSIAFKHMSKKMDRAVLEAKIGVEEMKELEL